MIFDDSGKLLESSMRLGNRLPVPPAGVLENAKTYGENRITWQPESSVRIAIVVKYYDGEKQGFVLAGRSLLEAEQREKQIRLLVLIGWALSLPASFIGGTVIKSILE